MEFEVKFFARSESEVEYVSEHVILLPKRQIGYNGVLKVWEELDVVLPLERISGFVITMQKYGYDIKLDTSVVSLLYREYGLFTGTNIEVIEVPPKYLNQFVYETVVAYRNKTTGEIVEARIERRVDDEALLEKWISDGAPQRWGFEEEAS